MFDVTLGRARAPMAVTQWGRQYSPVIVQSVGERHISAVCVRVETYE